MKLAFVTPWYGPDIPGGAEAETRKTASQLHQAGYDVEILTTCIRDFHADWATNYHKPGFSVEDELVVRRFRVEKRDQQTFDQINFKLMQGHFISLAEEEIFNNEMIHCPDLYAFISEHQEAYIFFFIPYMFTTTYVGAQICPERSIMIPCLHDEAYARLNIHKQVFPSIRALLLHVQAEKELADTLYPDSGKQIRAVIGEGVNTDWQGNGNRFREKYRLDNTPFVLYAGRRDAGKNTPQLIHYWQHYLQAAPHTEKLVLIGPGEISIPADAQDNILDLGFISMQDKYDAYAAATLLCQPSLNESFSLVIMESWLAGTPVLVHADCAVTRSHVRESNGGLYFGNYAEFSATLDYFFANPKKALQMGQQGRAYVLANFQWPTIVAKYDHIIKTIMADL
ncbi:MAG: glycosyltransferase family 4 protein [Ardenticatenaceae bacterium]|nr:glycosyltransferase family 4 protein [Ardenticatenaceae bacterium]